MLCNSMTELRFQICWTHLDIPRDLERRIKLILIWSALHPSQFFTHFWGVNKYTVNIMEWLRFINLNLRLINVNWHWSKCTDDQSLSTDKSILSKIESERDYSPDPWFWVTLMNVWVTLMNLKCLQCILWMLSTPCAWYLHPATVSVCLSRYHPPISQVLTTGIFFCVECEPLQVPYLGHANRCSTARRNK